MWYTVGMDKIDLHTHSFFSADGKAPLSDMVAAATAQKLLYYGISEHFDYDYEAFGVLVKDKTVRPIDADAYFQTARKEQLACKPTKMLVGCELGYGDHALCFEKYARVIETYRPDFVVNSVHTCDGKDCYFPDYCEGKEKHAAYGEYLKTVRKSLDAPYHYDIVAHIGYVSRNAPYPDRKMRYEDFPALFDDILKTVISKNAILEVNTSTRGAGSDCMPDADVLKRYFALGGRAVSFASDAHEPSRLCDKYESTVLLLEGLGFTHWTVPFRGDRISVPFA